MHVIFTAYRPDPDQVLKSFAVKISFLHDAGEEMDYLIFRNRKSPKKGA